ncbi:pyruvate kinase [Pseudomonas syringae group sp. J309-1]|uniref:pyruvate kinase n=1 Tax=Pseudomonas syringae group sp. J309-1 TaxID=3079588 RepID=UPI00290E20AE|nr:pyruvate kinase [Pseudomonas syringae group sp. J309-1]MDU8358205.1 pyruvate kinase [Pseudomonas syringae group sp. J309-1]
MTIIETDFNVLDEQQIRAALKRLSFLRVKMEAAARTPIESMQVHPDYLDSARNLLGYLALRRHDIRPLQQQLSGLGLSSLGRCEANALASVDRVIDVLKRLLPGAELEESSGSLVNRTGENLLNLHADQLFGGSAPERGVRIMVTMPQEAASNPSMVRELVQAGMDCQRINCAHDDPATWLKMIEHGRSAAAKVGRTCQVMMDLAGPKLRTGQIQPGPAVLKIRPQRDDFGRIVTAAQVWLAEEPEAFSDDDYCLQMPGKWLKQLQVGDELAFRDARDSSRSLSIVEVTEQGCRAELRKTAYMIPGIELHLKKHRGRPKSERITGVPPREQSIVLNEGDALLLSADASHGHPAVVDSTGKVLTPARIGCTLPEVFKDLRANEPVWFDDGKIGGRIQSVQADVVTVRITHAPGGAKLKSDKGINLPDSELQLDALSSEDLEALAFAAQHADVVELSFVNSPEDVKSLLVHLKRLNAEHLGVVLKIETRRGFESLAALLLAGMQNPRLGVMIARGDLAVENGFERTAELQEEILCICEAAHVPVIWATQVLDTLAKTGAATRAEITDAAMGVRAECVMLNKGPHILEAMGTLDDLLVRMQGHRSKKRDLLRKLSVAELNA